MAYNSSLNGQDFKEVCGIFICPLKTKVSGPAPLAKDDEEDIISEVLRYYRPNVMFKNYSVKGMINLNKLEYFKINLYYKNQQYNYKSKLINHLL